LRLSFNEIRARAANFAKTYADATYEKGETQTFYNDFFAIFGVERRSVARYDENVKKHCAKDAEHDVHQQTLVRLHDIFGDPTRQRADNERTDPANSSHCCLPL
jgi:hypothetical protein